MRVFKFGGASVKDSSAVKNVARVLNQTGYDHTIIVVSAMGKTTNALEQVVDAFVMNKPYNLFIKNIFEFHESIVKDLIENSEELTSIIQLEIKHLQGFLKQTDSRGYDFIYDQVVSFGELLSSKILSYYLNANDIKNEWLDSKTIIKTDSHYREAKVDWAETQLAINALNQDTVYVTQGFIGATKQGQTTTLGREGSDYTGAILSYCLNAESLTIWKDVQGVLNADPRIFESTELLTQISYEEAIELTYYGASVIHPKTIQPLQNKKIPLFVKSFENPQLEGTKITSGEALVPKLSCYILKKNQHLLRISTKDFSFINELVVSNVFKMLANEFIKVNLVQITAMSMSICVEDKYHKLDKIVNELSQGFEVDCIEGVNLFTIRHDEYKSTIQHPDETDALIIQSGKYTKQLVTRS